MALRRTPTDVLAQRRLLLTADELGVGGVYHLGRLSYDTASRPLRDHVHEDAMEICFLARGQQTYAVGAQRFRLRGGDVFLAFPDESHSTGGLPEEKSILYWLILDLQPEDRLLDLPAGEARSLVRTLASLPRRHFPGTADLHEPLDRVFLDHAAGASFLPTRTRAHLTEFLLQVVACAHQPLSERVSPCIARALACAQAQLSEDVRLETLAAEAGLSLSHFKRLFKKEVGMPPREYVLREKVAAAQQALQDPDRSITDIAVSLGFSTSAYFSTVFKRFTGQTPREMRQKRSAGNA